MDAIRQVGHFNAEPLSQLSAYVHNLKVDGQSVSLSKARILDILIWVEMAIKEGNSYWSTWGVDGPAALRPERQFMTPAPPPGEAATKNACPKCGSKMVQRSGPKGPFYGCSRYPDCKGTRSLFQCPQCGGEMVKCEGPRGPFYGCLRYPDCKGTISTPGTTRSTASCIRADFASCRTAVLGCQTPATEKLRRGRSKGSGPLSSPSSKIYSLDFLDLSETLRSGMCWPYRSQPARPGAETVARSATNPIPSPRTSTTRPSRSAGDRARFRPSLAAPCIWAPRKSTQVVFFPWRPRCSLFATCRVFSLPWSFSLRRGHSRSERRAAKPTNLSACRSSQGQSRRGQGDLSNEDRLNQERSLSHA